MDFSHTRIQTYNTCKRSYLHYYLRKIRTRKTPNYFVLGSAIHSFIEMFYRTKDAALSARQVTNIIDAVDRAILNREEIHALEVDKNIALGIAKAYPLFYKQDFDEFKAFLTEQEFRLPLDSLQIQGEKHFYTGKLDCLLQDHAGDWWILETKTVSAQSMGGDYFERVKIDSQVIGYLHAARAILGKWPKGVIYNAIKKPSIRLKNGESLSAFQSRVYNEYAKLAKEKGYFTREQIMVTGNHLNEWLSDTQILAQEIANRVNAKATHWPKNTGACSIKYGTCQFLQACITDAYNKLIYKKETK
jgi:hypothetical protein